MVDESKRYQRINELVRERKSTNQIQKQLSKEHMGMRRQKLLYTIRTIKGTKPKEYAYKYTPKKYLVSSMERLVKHATQHHVTVYGKVYGINKRFEVSGSGYELRNFLRVAVKYPPKRRIERVKADKTIDRTIFDTENDWDRRPTIES
jgi:hypothetical protein